MPSTYSPLLGLEEMATGENSNTWGTKTNTNLNLLEDAIAAYTTVNVVAGITTLTDLDGSVDQSRSAILQFNGTLISAATIEVPQTSKIWFMKDNTSGGQNVTVKTAVGSGLVLPAGVGIFVINDGVSCFGGYGTAAQRDMGSSAQNILDVSASDARYLQTGGGPVPVSLGGTGVSAFTGALIGLGTSTTAGIVPVSLGGVGVSVATTNGLVYGAGASYGFLVPTTGTSPTFTSSGWENSTPVLTTAFTSGGIAIAAGTIATCTHSFGVIPAIVQYYLQCVSADIGYTSGQILWTGFPMTNHVNAGGAEKQGASVIVDVSTLRFRFLDSYTFTLPNASTGAIAVASQTAWTIGVKAYA